MRGLKLLGANSWLRDGREASGGAFLPPEGVSPLICRSASKVGTADVETACWILDDDDCVPGREDEDAGVCCEKAEVKLVVDIEVPVTLLLGVFFRFGVAGGVASSSVRAI